MRSFVAHDPEWSENSPPFATREAAWRWIEERMRKHPAKYSEWDVTEVSDQ